MSPGKIKPLGLRLLVKRSVVKESVGGILLANSAKEKTKQGEVVGVSDGAFDESGKMKTMTVQEGDCVLFDSYAGTPISIDGEEDYLILNEDEVLAVLN